MGSGLTDVPPQREATGWVVDYLDGPAEQLFSSGASLVGGERSPSQPSLRVLTVLRPTVVLGSSQPLETADRAVCESLGIDVVRRRSGGGAVWLDDAMVWVDVFVPASHPRWDPDIGRSMWWIGDAWARALTVSGVDGAEVYRGPLIRSPWSSLVCFAGLGSGEVTVGGRKVVGISQRRARAGALMQCGLLRTWDARPLVEALAFASDDARAEAFRAVRDAGAGVGSAADAVLEAFVASVVTP